jgi:hypothetical protein
MKALSPTPRHRRNRIRVVSSPLSAQSLSGESNHLKLEVDKFLSTVRAA